MKTKTIEKKENKIYYQDLKEGQMFTFTEDSMLGYEPRMKTAKGHIQFETQMESLGDYNDEEVILLDGKLTFWEV